MYSVVYTKKAVNDIQNIKATKLEKKAKALIDLIKENPYQSIPSCEKLQGYFQGAYSKRININHRLVYEISEEKRTIKIISL